MDGDGLRNLLGPAEPGRSTVEGDVPQALRRRYLTETGRFGQGLGFYVDATTAIPSFRDRGRQLIATRSDPAAIRDMVAIARHRGWSKVVVHGATGFRREAWLAGRTQGLEVLGYRPTERDLQLLARRQEAQAPRRAADRAAPTDRPTPSRSRDFEAGARARLKVVDAVVRACIVEPREQRRILDAARVRLAELLERGSRVPNPPPREAGDAGRERRR
jgi:conjugative element/phage-associated large polyvalent protein